VHCPSDNVNPAPCTSSVQALNSEISIKRIEEQESGFSIVHWAADSVQEKEGDDASWGNNCLSKILSSSHHLFEV